ncbi:MAG TPA: hypothetical protein VNF07_03460 [Acidimicrobiales bacterium]|nr:hypothetical protein [Acidimicrobiales bacterium]
MSATRLQRALLAAYPARFRERYGPELLHAAEERGHGGRAALDLARGALSAWLRPSVGTAEERRRDLLVTSFAIAFLSWCASVAAAAAFSKAVDDERAPGLASWGWGGYSFARSVFEVSAGVVLLVGFGYWLAVVLPALRSRDRRVLVPACFPAPIVGCWLGLTGLVAWYARAELRGPVHHPGAVALAVLCAYALATVLAVGGCGASVVRALDAASLTTRQLRPALALVVLGAGALLAETVGSAIALSRVLAVGGIGLRGAVLALSPILVLLGAAGMAVVSSTMGARLWRPTAGD